MWLNVHVTSLGAAAGAVVITTFLIFSLGYLVFITRDRIPLRYLLLQRPPFLPYLTGYAFYTSGTEPAWILLWYRVSITGLLLTPLAFEFFLESLLEQRRPLTRALLADTFRGRLLILLWFVPSSMASGEITLHPAARAGLGRQGTALPLVHRRRASDDLSLSLSWFLVRIYTGKGLFRRYRFILAGILIWFLAGMLDAPDRSRSSGKHGDSPGSVPLR